MQHKDRLTDEERKARRKATAKKYREANREKCTAATLAAKAKKPDYYKEKNREYKQDPGYIERQRQYRAENRERLTAKTMEWRHANNEAYRAYQRAYQVANRLRSIQRTAEWRKNNGARVAAHYKLWRRANLNLLARKEHRRRARIKGVGGDLSVNIHERLMVQQKGKCVVCLVSLKDGRPHLDHIMPISKGGANIDSNVQLLCRSCNLSKNAKHPIDFMQERGFLC